MTKFWFNLVAISCLFAVTAQAQTLPGNAQLKGRGAKVIGLRAACNNKAGSIRFDQFNGQSNTVSNKLIYLCFNDSLRVLHNGDFDLSSDPDRFSPAGIRYALYDCPPNISGPALSDIRKDSCLNVTSPIIVNGQQVPQTNGIWLSTSGTPGGNINLFNRGDYQSAFNGGKPISFWFAPITVDDWANNAYEPDPTTGVSGACVNVNTAAAFQVVYLNAISASNILTTVDGSGCQGSFIARGGMPELDTTEFYTVRISLDGNPSIAGRVLTTRAGHLDEVRFFVPQPGTYNITVEDGKSCEATFQVTMSGCTAVNFSFPFLNAKPGDSICVDLTVSNFNNVGTLEMDIAWDPTVIQFKRVQNYNNKMAGLGPASISLSGRQDTLRLSWFNPNFQGINLNNGEALFQVCFNVIGRLGQSSPLRLLPSGIPEETVGTAEPKPLGYVLNSGQVNVSNDVLFVDFKQDSVKCDGGANGSITVTAANGTPPYSISWNTLSPLPANSGVGTINASGGSFRIPNLLAGRYEVRLRDATSPTPNSVIDTVEVFEPPILAVRLNAKDPSCFGSSDGSVEAVILINAVPQPNPGPEYSFRWNIPGETGPKLDSIPAGFYAVTVTNAANCSSNASTNLSPPAPIVLVPNITNATCSGVSNGRIVLNASGGFIGTSNQYTFRWQGPSGSLGTNRGLVSTLTGLLSGSYCVTVTDDNGCSTERCFAVGAIKNLLIDTALVNASCNGICDGTIIVNGSTVGANAALPYRFTWSGTLGGAPVNTPTSSTIANLCAGTYIVTMRDADPVGCQVTDTLVITEPEPLNVALRELVNETCVVGRDGRASVQASGGTTPYQFQWSNGQTDSAAVNLVAGNYRVRVIDTNDCETALDVTIQAPTPPQITALVNDTLACSSDRNGALSVTATQGGAPIVTYEWSNGVIGQSISNLAPGAYTINILAADGCRTVDTAFVVAPQPIRIDSVRIDPPRCPGEPNAQVTLFPGGGTAPYTYIWQTTSGSDTTAFPLRPGLKAGSYAYTVTDVNRCPGVSQSVTVVDPPKIVLTYSDTTAVSCFEGVCDGRVTVAARYDNGQSGAFNFAWSSGETFNGVTSSRAIRLCRGNNGVVVVDSNACAIVDSIAIPSPPEILIAARPTPVSCNGGSDGRVAVTVSGGTPGYQYLWLETGASSDSIFNLIAGKYNIQVTDSRGCTKQREVELLQPDSLKLTLDLSNTKNASCNGQANGQIRVLVNINDAINPLGAAPFTWSDNAAPGNAPAATNLKAGTYFVTVTDSKGCQDTLSHTITEPEPIVAVIPQPTDPRCFGESTFLRIDTIYGGNGANLLDYTYMINNNGLSFSPIQRATIFAGTIVVTIEDQLGCKLNDTLVVNQPEELRVIFDPKEIVVELGDSLTRLDPLITSSLQIDSFRWSPPANLSAANIQNPFIVNLLDDQLYTLTIVDVNGCKTSGSVFVELDRNRNVYIPNAFSPNGDGRNDEFRAFTCKGVTSINFALVYDRWGNLVYEGRNIGPDCLSGALLWDGRVRGKDAAAGVYVYMVEVQFLDNVKLLYRGDVAIVK